MFIQAIGTIVLVILIFLGLMKFVVVPLMGHFENKNPETVREKLDVLRAKKIELETLQKNVSATREINSLSNEISKLESQLTKLEQEGGAT